MKSGIIIASIAIAQIISASFVFAQAFGEYGRSVGSAPHGKSITGSKGSGGVSQGKSRGKSVGDGVTVVSRALPPRLVVATNDAGLYPRQDDESQKIDQLNQGEVLTPMVQSAGGNEWYMVKTRKGLVGWVKSADVREEKPNK